MELIAHITQDIRYVVEHKEHQSSQIQPFHLSSFHLKHSVLIRITGGNAQFFFDLNETLPQMIYSNDIIYIEKGCTFSFNHKKTLKSDHVQVIELTEDVLKRALPVCTYISPVEHRKLPGRMSKYYSVKSEHSLDNTFEYICRNATAKIIDKTKMVSSVCYLLSVFTKHHGFIDSLERAMSSSYSERIHKIISSDIKCKWTLQLCAKKLHVSIAALKRKLQKEGSSFRTVYLDTRMCHALNLIKKSSKSVSEVAYESGFRSSSSFCTAFRKYYGITPTKVNKTLQNKA
ncbi:helix-turn-helix domain-containing protein [Escherichia fergusonii]|uniref:helix-turn-helix domain-containing protein n=1 Tax=Escherichia fergusonii TaxID=564 RepID=UPI0015EA7C67|nr:helix-turn-helix domain-containing protein [Escherichia fergusonii]QMF16514.1 helix-turn-helix domain-containing protein [Escherichia fergusonii]